MKNWRKKSRKSRISWQKASRKITTVFSVLFSSFKILAEFFSKGMVFKHGVGFSLPVVIKFFKRSSNIR